VSGFVDSGPKKRITFYIHRIEIVAIWALRVLYHCRKKTKFNHQIRGWIDRKVDINVVEKDKASDSASNGTP